MMLDQLKHEGSSAMPVGTRAADCARRDVREIETTASPNPVRRAGGVSLRKPGQRMRRPASGASFDALSYPEYAREQDRAFCAALLREFPGMRPRMRPLYEARQRDRAARVARAMQRRTA